MDIEKKFKFIEEEISNIEKKIDSKFKTFLVFIDSKFMHFIYFIFAGFWGFSLVRNFEEHSSIIFTLILLLFFSISPFICTHILEFIFKKTKKSKLTKQQNKIFFCKYFLLNNKENKKIKNIFNIFFEYYSFKIDQHYFNSVLGFLNKQSEKVDIVEFFNFFSEHLLAFLYNKSITQHEFNYYLSEYIDAANIKDKQVILKILNNKDEIIDNRINSNDKVNQFLLRKEKTQKYNQNTFINDKIKF
tara:strand:+ start:17807 stop:18541 length:735 start_codon:yes stop_codon:yes gene_type:complete